MLCLTNESLEGIRTCLASSSSSSSTYPTTSLPSSVILTLEEKEGLLELLCVIVRCKISLDDEEGILSSAMKLEEEAIEKEDEEEEITEEEKEKWNSVGSKATLVIKALLKKKGVKMTMRRAQSNEQALEDALKKEAAAEKRAEEAEKRETSLLAYLQQSEQEKDRNKTEHEASLNKSFVVTRPVTSSPSSLPHLPREEHLTAPPPLKNQVTICFCNEGTVCLYILSLQLLFY